MIQNFPNISIVIYLSNFLTIWPKLQTWKALKTFFHNNHVLQQQSLLKAFFRDNLSKITYKVEISGLVGNQNSAWQSSLFFITSKQRGHRQNRGFSC